MRSLRYTDLAGEQKGSFPNHGSLEVKDFGRTCGQISRPEHVTMPAPPVYFALCVYHPPPRTFGDSANGDLSRGQGRPPVGGAAEEESRRSRSLNTPVGSDPAGGPPAASSGRTAEQRRRLFCVFWGCFKEKNLSGEATLSRGCYSQKNLNLNSGSALYTGKPLTH